MSIPTAVDGVTPVDAALLNAYKSGIEACELDLGLPASSGYLLSSDDEGNRDWVPAPSTTPTTTAGDMIVRGAADDERLPVGDEGQALVVSGGVPAWGALPASQTVLPSTCDARLTLTTGVPVTTADVTAASNLYLTRYQGAHVALWGGSAWVLHEVPSADVALVLSGLTSGANYDVFLHDSTGTLTLSLSAAWANATTRTDALAVRDGVRVLAADHGKRLVGTLRTTAATTTEDSLLKRFLRNEARPVPRVGRFAEGTDNWTYSTNQWRQANGNAAAMVQFLAGPTDLVEIRRRCASRHTSTGGGRAAGVGIDAVDAVAYGGIAYSEGGFYVHHGIHMSVRVAEGYHYAAPLETAYGSTATWYGDGAGLGYLFTEVELCM